MAGPIVRAGAVDRVQNFGAFFLMRCRIGDIANGPDIEGVILKDLVGPIAFDGGAVAIVLSVFEHLVVQGPLGIQEKMTEVVHIIDQALTGTAEFKFLAGIVDGRDRAIDSRKLRGQQGYDLLMQKGGGP